MLEMHTRQSDRSVKIAVGMLIFASMAAFLMLVWINSTHMNPLSETYTLNVALDHGQGIQEGATVTLVGIPVGQVENIKLGSNAKVLMSLRLLKSYQAHIRADSVIFLIKPVVGVSKLDISLGTSSALQLESGDQLSFKKQAVFDEILETIPPKMLLLDSILANLNTMSQQLATTEGPFQKSLQSISATTQNFEKLSTEAVGAVNQVQSIISDIDKIAQQGAAVMAQIERSTERAPELVGRLEAILLQLDELAGSMKNISLEVEKTRTDIPELISKSRNAVSEADDILRALKTTPILNSAFEKPAAELLIDTPRDALP